MKRQVKHKPNEGPTAPRNRADARARSEAFIAGCEASLVRVLEQHVRETKPCTYKDLETCLNERLDLLCRHYPQQKAKVLVAGSNVRKALHLVQEEEKRACATSA